MTTYQIQYRIQGTCYWKGETKPYLDIMTRQIEGPFQVGYHPEIDFSPELDEKVVEKHLHLFGILQWSNEICCIDITIEVSMLSQHQCSPQEGQLDALY